MPTARGAAAAGKQPAFRAALGKAGQAHIKARLVGIVSAAPDKDGIHLGALGMNVGAGYLSRQPGVLACGPGKPQVLRERKLERDMRPVEALLIQISGKAISAGLAFNHIDDKSRTAQPADAGTSGALVGIKAADHHAPHT